MKSFFRLVGGLGLVSLLSAGCMTYKKKTAEFINMPCDINHQLRVEASEHSCYDIVPRNSQQIRLYDLPHWTSWALFGNQEDGIFGEDQNDMYSTNFTTFTAVRWVVRNPLHNICYHVPPFGTKDIKGNHHFTLFNLSNEEQYAFKFGKDNARTFGKGKAGVVLGFYPLPFISLKTPYFPPFQKHRFEFYIGKRPHGLGFKLMPHGEVGEE